MLDLWLTLLLTLNQPDHPKALSPTSVRTQIERIAIENYGHTGWACIDRLTYRESRWNPFADNPHSSAQGLFQLLRMPADTPIAEQYARFRRYLDRRYEGSPCRALDHSDRRGWY